MSLKNNLQNLSQDYFQELIMLCKKRSLTTEETANLAQTLAHSGTVFETNNDAIDLASTGAPSSLSTIIAPLFCVLLGKKVIKLGVPGRPAGGIDILSIIPNYKINLSKEEIFKILDKASYVHFIANDDFCPLDAKLFKYRQDNNAQTLPDLVIASLLSKKIAVGVKTIGLDIRIASHGNFGTTYKQAKNNSLKFIEVAKNLGIKATCFLTDATQPYQPYIGRGEVLIGLANYFEGAYNAWFNEHVDCCKNMAIDLLSYKNQSLTAKDAQNTFSQNLHAQGTRYEIFREKVENIKKEPYEEYCAPRSGLVSYDLRILRQLILKNNSANAPETELFPDSFGITLLSKPSQWVLKGEPLAKIRSTKREFDLKQRLAEGICIEEKPKNYKMYEVIY